MSVEGFVEAFGLFMIGYFALLNGTYLVFTAMAWRMITEYQRSRSHQAVEEAFASPLTPPISIFMPAYNESASIVESVRSVLALRYPEFEVVVINDGSTDDTLARLMEAFELVETATVAREGVAHAPIHRTFLSARYPELVVVDKENGGKPDAQNAGMSVARYPYICAIDSDGTIEDGALLRIAKPLLDDPETVAATGGIVRIINGCEVDHGRVTQVGLPRNPLATFQVLEYFRAFLVGRLAWSRMRSLLIISGAFGLFRREAVEAVGGWSNEHIGEDMELVLRLHRYFRERGERYRIEFVADPVCWTEVPETLKGLSKQRRRWQQGLIESLWTHRRMMLNPRYGAVGMIGFPYFVFFEMIGPLIAVLGYLVLPIGFALGAINLALFVAFLVVAVLLGQLLSISALALEEFSFRRHEQRRDIWRLVLYSLIENLGYRQLNDVWRIAGFRDLIGESHWGEQERRGIGSEPVSPEA
jgi:cellulose synthase/poly-beta-1,6-N-acetylglucosamine synthase-like glycosyltransferase